MLMAGARSYINQNISSNKVWSLDNDELLGLDSEFMVLKGLNGFRFQLNPPLLGLRPESTSPLALILEISDHRLQTLTFTC